jgi:acetyl-CoA carboxylase biotin carboxyl carrier protein
MNLEIISQLVRLLKDEPDVGAIEIRRGWFGAWTSIRVSKADHGSNAGTHIVAVPTGHAAAAIPAPPAVVDSPAAAVAPAGPKFLEIKSPMVGTFYGAPEAGAPPYVKSGSRVATGEVVCIIEAMKIMNEIEAEIAGVIREVCVENAQPVDFGQVLFKVDPNA